MACSEVISLATAAATSLAGILEPDLGDLVDVSKLDDLPDWHVAEYDFSHPHFETDWRRSQVALQQNDLLLSLEPHKAGQNLFVSGSIRHQHRTHFGRYQARLRPAAGQGLVTGLFVYTGPSYGTRHDEIDIEFLGKDTGGIHLATFVDGVLSNWFVPLGFDAAHASRRYGFDWYPDRLIWHVDGCEIFRIEGPDAPIPKTPGFMFANLWAVDHALENWAGVPEQDAKASAIFSEFSFTPFGPAETAATKAKILSKGSADLRFGE